MDNRWQKQFPQGRAHNIVPDGEPTICFPCGQSFKSWDLYHKHKITHPKHRGKTCAVCSRDFQTVEGCKIHSLKLHAQKQSLNCPACQMHFSRLGSMIHHLERGLCGDSAGGKFSECVRERNKFYDNDLNVRNKSEYGATSGDFMNDTDQPISRATGTRVRQATSADFVDDGIDQIIRATEPMNLDTAIRLEGTRPEAKKIEYKPVDKIIIAPVYCKPKLSVSEQPEFDGDAIISFDSPTVPSPLVHFTNVKAATVSKPFSEDLFSPSVGTDTHQIRSPENKEKWWQQLPRYLIPDDADLMEKLESMTFNQEINLTETFDEIAYLRGAPPYMSTEDFRNSMVVSMVNGGKSDQKGIHEYFMPDPPRISDTTSEAQEQSLNALEKISSTLWSTPQDPWARPTPTKQAVVVSQSKLPQLPTRQIPSSQSGTWGSRSTAFEVNTALTKRLRKTSLDEPAHHPSGITVEATGAVTEFPKKTSFDVSTNNPWGVGPVNNLWRSESAYDSWGTGVENKDLEANRIFSVDPSDPSFRAEAYWIQALGKYKCPHKACKKSFEKKMSFLTHLRSFAHMGAKERLQCRKCLNWFGSATALAQHAESQGLCILRDSDQYTRCVDEFTAGYAAPAGRHQDSTVRYVVNQDKKGKVDSKNIASKMIEGHKTLTAEKMKTEEKYWEVYKPKW